MDPEPLTDSAFWGKGEGRRVPQHLSTERGRFQCEVLGNRFAAHWRTDAIQEGTDEVLEETQEEASEPEETGCCSQFWVALQRLFGA